MRVQIYFKFLVKKIFVKIFSDEFHFLSLKCIVVQFKQRQGANLLCLIALAWVTNIVAERIFLKSFFEFVFCYF